MSMITTQKWSRRRRITNGNIEVLTGSWPVRFRLAQDKWKQKYMNTRAADTPHDSSPPNEATSAIGGGPNVMPQRSGSQGRNAGAAFLQELEQLWVQ